MIKLLSKFLLQQRCILCLPIKCSLYVEKRLELIAHALYSQVVSCVCCLWIVKPQQTIDIAPDDYIYIREPTYIHTYILFHSPRGFSAKFTKYYCIPLTIMKNYYIIKASKIR